MHKKELVVFGVVAALLIAGVAIYSRSGKPGQAELPGTEFAPATSSDRVVPAADATSSVSGSAQSLKTYRNDAYGFTLAYPSDWKKITSSVSGLLTLRRYYLRRASSSSESMQGICEIGFFAMAKDPNRALRDWAAGNYKAGTIMSSSALNIGGKEAVKIISQGAEGTGTAFYITLANSNALIVPLLCGDDVRKTGARTLDQILATLKFTK